MRRWLSLLVVVTSSCSKPIDPQPQIDGQYLAGQSAFAQGDFKKAHEHFAEVKRLAPSDRRLATALGELYLAESKLSEALVSFEEAALVEPKRASTWSRLGFLLRLRGEHPRARVALEKALALNPKDFNAAEQLAEVELAEGHLEKAVRRFVEGARLAGDANGPLLYLRAANELGRRGKDDEALAVLEAAADAGARSEEFSTQLGELLVRKGRLEEASAAFIEAAQGSGDPTLMELVGELETKLGRLPEAEAAFRESLRIKDRGVVHVALARLCLSKKDEACARQELDLAFASATGEELRESLELADLLELLGRKKDAVSLLSALAQEPERAKDGDLQLKVARLAKQTGQKAVLKEACERAVDAGVPSCP